MENTKSISSPLKRISILDSLRGFALLGVILIHMIQHFGFFTMPSGDGILHSLKLDQAVSWIGNNIIMGRFINIFALLFGLSFFIQMDRASKKGIDFRARFAWRMFILLLIGLIIHSFYSLEIISIYALFGFLLIALYKAKNWILICLAALLLLGAPRYIQAKHHNSQLNIEQQLTSNAPNQVQAREGDDNKSAFAESFDRYKSSYIGKLNYQFKLIGRGYLTLALFILGLIVGRIRFFETINQHRKRNLYLFGGFVVLYGVIMLITSSMADINTRMLFRPQGEISNAVLFKKMLEDLSMLAFTGILVMGFVLMYGFETLRKRLDVLCPYGRMALSNYIAQDFIGYLLFSSSVFGSTFGMWGTAALFTLGILLYVAQCIISKYWLKYYLYGPVEWLWRSLTYLKMQPFKKVLNS